jgi:ParB/RepB/Spo0J family partition protein
MTIQLINIDKITPNAWNPNVMPDGEYQALKQDMHIHGVNGVDPILVSLKGVYQLEGEISGEAWTKAFEVKGYVIVDGEHRWKVAKELGWKQILCTTEAIKEEDAKALCYRRNRERGTIDPFKEALLFKSDLPKLTQAKIAGKYGVDESTVSHRLSLLKLDAKIVEAVEKLPRGMITPSHLEPIATLEPDDQKSVAKSMIEDASRFQLPWTVKDVQEKTAWRKRLREEEESLKEAVKTAKYPKCPKCGKPPGRVNYKNLPWVDCSSLNYNHAWNLRTGKNVYEEEHPRQKDLDGKSKPIPSKTIRCAHTVEELWNVFLERAKEIVPKVEKANHFEIRGKLAGQEFGVDMATWGKSMNVSVHKGATYSGFRAEEHEYKSGEKSSVDAGSPEHVEDTKHLIENAFQGKLEIVSKRLKKAKTAGEIIHELHSEPLEAEKIDVTDDPKDSLAAEEEASS